MSCSGSMETAWVTKGLYPQVTCSGIIHQEMPKVDPQDGMHGFQLWANPPAAQKMMPPRYRGITAEQIPRVELDNGVRIRVIARVDGDTRGPMDDIVM